MYYFHGGGASAHPEVQKRSRAQNFTDTLTANCLHLPKAWSLSEPGAIVEVAPWEHGFANLGGNLVLRKRVEKPLSREI